MKTPMHNYFKGKLADNSAYYPYSIFSRRTYAVPPEKDLRVQYRFNTIHTIGHAAMMAIFMASLLISAFFKLADPKSVFIIYIITLPLLIILLNWEIANILTKDLNTADCRIGFKQRVCEVFTKSHHSKIVSSVGVIALLTLFIFIPSRGWIGTRIWIAAMCFYDYLVGWVI